MLETTVGGVKVRISLLFPAAVILLLSCDPSHTILMCLLASLLHEAGHALAMLIVHDRPCRVTMGIFGISIERTRERYLSYAAMAAVSAAGPLMNIVCGIGLWFAGCYTGALIHAALALFNGLPILSLDGGEALYALLCLRFSEDTALRAVRLVSVAVLFPLAVIGFRLLLSDNHNFTLLLMSGYLILLLFLKEKH